MIPYMIQTSRYNFSVVTVGDWQSEAASGRAYMQGSALPGPQDQPVDLNNDLSNLKFCVISFLSRLASQCSHQQKILTYYS